jgi:hypothetical protein
MRRLLYITVALLASCHSEIDDEPDYRDSFVGHYTGTRTNSSWIMGQPPTSNTFADTVHVVAVGDSMLMIDGVEILISASGEYFSSPYPSNYYSATFTTPDSLELDQNSGGLGGGNHSSFKGKKY